MILMLVSILLSVGIVVFAWRQAAVGFGGYRLTVKAVKDLQSQWEPVVDGDQLQRALRAAKEHPDRIARYLVRALAQPLMREPIRAGRVVGWAVDVEHLCDGTRWFRRHPRYGLLETMPGLLTGAGILFTFLGLIVGLYGLNPTDANQLTSGVQRLLGGMSVAFLTSVAGIASALGWSWAQRRVVFDFEDAFYRLGEALQNKAFLLSPFDLEDQLVQHLADQSAALDDLDERIGAAIVRALEEAGFIRDDEAEDLDLTKPMNEASWVPSLREELANLGDRLGELAKAQSQLQGGGPAVARPVSTAGSTEQVERLQRVQLNVINDVAAAVKSLRDVTEKANQIGAVMGKQQDAAARQLDSLEQMWGQYRDQMNSMQATLARTLAGLQTELPKSLRAIHGEFDQLLADSLQRFAKAMEDFDTNLQSLALLMNRRSDRES